MTFGSAELHTGMNIMKLSVSAEHVMGRQRI